MKNLHFFVSLPFCILLLFITGCNSETNSRESTTKSINEEQNPLDILQSDEVKNEAKSELASLPGTTIINKMDLPTTEKQAMHEIVALIKSAADSGLTEEEYYRLQEQNRVIEEAMKDESDSGGNQGNDTTDDCTTVYQNCLRNHNCDGNATICLCCAPCSVKYAKCLVSIRTRNAKKTEAAATEGKIGS